MAYRLNKCIPDAFIYYRNFNQSLLNNQKRQDDDPNDFN